MQDRGRVLILHPTPAAEEVAARAGFEPATVRLTAGCTTAVLPSNFKMVSLPGIGPGTCGLGNRRSVQLSYKLAKWTAPLFSKVMNPGLHALKNYLWWPVRS